MKILIVEDNASQREVIERLLKAAWPQAEVFLAKDGFEAGVKAAETLPDVIVTDINIPGLDGYWVCRAIRTNPRLSPTRILAMSGNNDPDLRARIMGAGADDFLLKPYRAAELVQRVKALLQPDDILPLDPD